MGNFLATIGGFKVYILVGLAATCLGFAGGIKWQDGAVQRAKGEVTAIKHKATEDANRQLVATLQFERQQGAVTNQVAIAAAEHQVAIQTRTIETVREVPRYVTREADARCTVPVGAVRLHDAAAKGVPPDAVSFAAGKPNDAASGVDLSRLMSVAAANYGSCLQVRQNYIDLQSWVRGQQAVSQASP